MTPPPPLHQQPTSSDAVRELTALLSSPHPSPTPTPTPTSTSSRRPLAAIDAAAYASLLLGLRATRLPPSQTARLARAAAAGVGGGGGRRPPPPPPAADAAVLAGGVLHAMASARVRGVGLRDLLVFLTEKVRDGVAVRNTAVSDATVAAAAQAAWACGVYGGSAVDAAARANVEAAAAAAAAAAAGGNRPPDGAAAAQLAWGLASLRCGGGREWAEAAVAAAAQQLPAPALAAKALWAAATLRVRGGGGGGVEGYAAAAREGLLLAEAPPRELRLGHCSRMLWAMQVLAVLPAGAAGPAVQAALARHAAAAAAVVEEEEEKKKKTRPSEMAHLAKIAWVCRQRLLAAGRERKQEGRRSHRRGGGGGGGGDAEDETPALHAALRAVVVRAGVVAGELRESGTWAEALKGRKKKGGGGAGAVRLRLQEYTRHAASLAASAGDVGAAGGARVPLPPALVHTLAEALWAADEAVPAAVFVAAFKAVAAAAAAAAAAATTTTSERRSHRGRRTGEAPTLHALRAVQGRFAELYLHPGRGGGGDAVAAVSVQELDSFLAAAADVGKRLAATGERRGGSGSGSSSSSSGSGIIGEKLRDGALRHLAGPRVTVDAASVRDVLRCAERLGKGVPVPVAAAVSSVPGAAVPFGGSTSELLARIAEKTVLGGDGGGGDGTAAPYALSDATYVTEVLLRGGLLRHASSRGGGSGGGSALLRRHVQELVRRYAPPRVPASAFFAAVVTVLHHVSSASGGAEPMVGRFLLREALVAASATAAAAAAVATVTASAAVPSPPTASPRQLLTLLRCSRETARSLEAVFAPPAWLFDEVVRVGAAAAAAPQPLRPRDVLLVAACLEDIARRATVPVEAAARAAAAVAEGVQSVGGGGGSGGAFSMRGAPAGEVSEVLRELRRVWAGREGLLAAVEAAEERACAAGAAAVASDDGARVASLSPQGGEQRTVPSPSPSPSPSPLPPSCLSASDDAGQGGGEVVEEVAEAAPAPPVLPWHVS